MGGVLAPWLACLVVLPVSAVSARETPAAFPRQVQGIWYSDDAEGRARCKAFLGGLAADDGEAYNFLVGAEVIRAGMWHSYAEYGEGNFYEIRTLGKIGKRSWRVSTLTGIDTMPDPEFSAEATFRFRIDKGILTWVFESFDGTPVDSWDEQRLFRCAPVPEGMYAS
ncbi:hypothetical protein G6N82_10620 [Altererythrobacter sp. BO-6]|uniref:hypothetical protein n=1 Tax=Altererythrobacter sp. BO-6 TaxID=2604537 RepID=UPI0013E176D8|nr:hypothetical protein [Altererythrobacter sp. BO-6]QIG54546.1 hypothetical protein G6N82_10620 [Altererythrobacter sp. BO-6]